MVFDVSMWNLTEGNHLVLVKGVGPKSKNTMKEGDNKGRLFQLNADCSISPTRAPHLVLGATRPAPQRKRDIAGRIEFLGLWKDTSDRAMPIKMQVKPDNPHQMKEAVENLLNELVASGRSEGLVAFQSYNQCHWSTAPGDESYKKHGFLSRGPPQRSSWSKRVHTSEGIMIPGLRGKIDILGGDWQNAVYKIVLEKCPECKGTGCAFCRDMAHAKNGDVWGEEAGAAVAPTRPKTVNGMGGDGVADQGLDLVVHAARYGWAADIWRAAPGFGHQHAGGAKDVADIVRGLIADDELHINPQKQPQYMNRTFWPETAGGPAIPRKLAVRYSYGVDGRVITVQTPAVPNETVALHITRGQEDAEEGQEDVGAGRRDQLSAEDMQGCWGCVCLPGFAAIERKRAEGPDVLVHEGLCFPLLSFYSESWDREGASNSFRKRGTDDRINYASAGGPLCTGLAVTCRLCGAECCVPRRRPRRKITAQEIQGCWGCVTSRCVCAALERRRAEGEDTLVHEGVCFPLLLPYSEPWDREGETNTFVKRGKDDRLEYRNAGGPIIGKEFITCRLCKY